ncbi:hypothetical protein KIPB_005925 [Kipferlia bialata]|uniref:Uncharacterized protein n=1 Tax=Kipferlia bialata TaxID=797122 RepID=A0A9K3CWF6_9EUKA|nr:hypothetical protein KIPB_005925 [Kipferlia bialata]|eukprot:g5925.t1
MYLQPRPTTHALYSILTDLFLDSDSDGVNVAIVMLDNKDPELLSNVLELLAVSCRYAPNRHRLRRLNGIQSLLTIAKGLRVGKQKRVEREGQAAPVAFPTDPKQVGVALGVGRALQFASRSHRNRKVMVRCNGIPLLVDLLTHSDRKVLVASAGALDKIAASRNGRLGMDPSL